MVVVACMNSLLFSFDVGVLISSLQVGVGHVCLVCNEKGRGFRSTMAVQNHMVRSSLISFYS